MLSIPEKKEFDHPASIIYFEVDNLKEVYESFSGMGIHFDQEPAIVARMESSDLWMAFFRDSENNPLCITSEVKRG